MADETTGGLVLLTDLLDGNIVFLLHTRQVSFSNFGGHTLTSPTSGGRSAGIVRLRTKATEFVLYILYSVDQALETATV
jgi:hypothetical protein